jgi:hypothetical protein
MHTQEQNKMGALRFKPESRFWFSIDQEHTPGILRISMLQPSFRYAVLPVLGVGKFYIFRRIPKNRKRLLPDRFLISRSDEFTLCESFTYSAQILVSRHMMRHRK